MFITDLFLVVPNWKHLKCQWILVEGAELYPQKDMLGASLMVQWLRICLPTEGAWVWSLVRELRFHILQIPRATTTEACAPRVLDPSRLRSLQLEKAQAQQWRHSTAINR